MQIAIMSITGIVGAEFFYWQPNNIIPFLPDWLMFKHLIVLFVWVNVINFTTRCLIKMLASVDSGMEKAIVVSRLSPLIFIIGSFAIYDREDPLLTEYAAAFFTSFGVMFALITSKLIICTMSKMTFSVFHPEVLLLLMYPAVRHFDLPLPQGLTLLV